MTELANNFFIDLATELSKLTNGGWDATVDNNGNHIVTEKVSQLAFYCRVGGYGNEGKIKIVYDRPRDLQNEWVYIYQPNGGGQVADPSIKVSDTKTTAVIAKDMVRRLLNESKALHIRVMSRIADNNAYINKRSSLANELAAICNAKVSNAETSPSINPYESILPRAGVRCGYGNISVSSDSADLKLTSLPPVVAKEIVAAVFAILKAPADRTTTR